MSASNTSSNRRATSRSVVTLRAVEAVNSRFARGLPQQLRAAGWLPGKIQIDEQRRTPVQWRDEDGRRCVARPYGRVRQWEVRVQRLPHERDEARDLARIKIMSDQVVCRLDQERAEERALAKQRATAFPKSAAQYRDGLRASAQALLDALLAQATGRPFGGACGIDEDSLDELRQAAGRIMRTLEAATYRIDPRAGERLRVEADLLAARHNDELQIWLRQVGARP